MRYKYLPVSCFLLGFMLLSSPHVSAQSESSSFGIGVMIGEPTGVSVKNWFGSRTAVDVGAAWSLSQNEAIHLHSNFLIHNAFTDTPRLSFYYGLGGRVIFADTPKAGIRVPVGLSFLFENAPFDLFVEAAPILDITPDVSLSGNGGFGFRYYF